MTKPVLLTVDDDPGVSRAVARDLRRRYGESYRVVRADSAAQALEALRELKLRGEPVAAMLADYRMPQMNGIEFLEEAMDLFPLARRALLTAYADTDAAIQAINVVDVDHYLLKPWEPPEEKLYPVVDALIEMWRALGDRPVNETKLVGHRWSSESYRARDFLARNSVPYRWYSVDEPEGRRLLAAAGAAADDVPVLITADGAVLWNPSDAGIAAAVGLSTEPATDFYDLVVVRAGPVAGMRHKLAVLAGSELGADELKHLTAIQEEIVNRMPSVPELSPLQASDREDELADWLDDNGATSGWEIAPTLVAGGAGIDDLQRVADALGASYLDSAVRWLAYTVETETLLSEIENATGRISALVGAAKQYSQMDRSSHQSIDVHDGLNSTLIMLSRKIGDQVTVVKDYDPNLPKVPTYAAELNQVWTNLIDNAVDAMHRSGTLTLHTARDGEQLLVEIGDTGPGVPYDMRQQIFEPFFTTKPVGDGTGLGLDVSWRIVVNRHGGSLRVISEPGDTRFQVRLPLTEPSRRREGAAT